MSKAKKARLSSRDYEYALRGYSRIYYQEHRLIPETVISLIVGFLNFWQQFVVTADQCSQFLRASEVDDDGDTFEVDPIELDPFYFGQFKFESRLVCAHTFVDEETDRGRVHLRLDITLPHGILCVGGYFGWQVPGQDEVVRYGRFRRSGTNRFRKVTDWTMWEKDLQKAEGLSFAQYIDIRQVEFMYTPDTIDMDDIDIMPSLSKTGHHRWEMDGKSLTKGQESDIEGWRIWKKYCVEYGMVEVSILPSHLPLPVWAFVLKVTVNGTIETVGHEIIVMAIEKQIEIDCRSFEKWQPGTGWFEAEIILPDNAHLVKDSTISLEIDWEVVKVLDDDVNMLW